MKKKGRKKIILLFVIIAIIGIVTGSILFAIFYQKIYSPNINLHGKNEVFLYIPTGANADTVYNILFRNNYIKNQASFIWVADKKNYRNHIHPGCYRLHNDMSNNQLINILRSGKQTPVKITFNNIRTKQQLAARIAEQLEPDSAAFMQSWRNKKLLNKYNTDSVKVVGFFIPNTYEFYWNTSPGLFLQRMHNEYKKFWNKTRLKKAKEIGLTPFQVITLASIVQAEQSVHNDEKARVAGLYINRLNKGMLLQADPTVVFAIGNFSIKRVLNSDKEIDSPYNTYKYAGLPPGPVNLPEISSIKAVLNFEKHSYLYMCAKDDFSGYHYFAKTLAQHNVYARKYRRALDRKNIKR